MVSNNTQTARQGRLIAPIIYDKLPNKYVSVEKGTLGFKWTDVNGNEKLEIIQLFLKMLKM